MKILSIGNSFSQDAQRYLHRVALREGVQMKTVNLYIGGCPLRTHYLNILDDNTAYDFQFNGESTGRKVSIRQVLASDNFPLFRLGWLDFGGLRYYRFCYCKQLLILSWSTQINFLLNFQVSTV